MFWMHKIIQVIIIVKFNAQIKKNYNNQKVKKIVIITIICGIIYV